MTHYNLASERVRLGLTQGEMAKNLGCGVKSLGKYENDVSSMPPRLIIKASEIFNCSIDYILDLTDDRRPTVDAPEQGPADDEGEKMRN